MAGLNRRIEAPVTQLRFWSAAVGGDQSLVDAASGLLARAVVVGNVGTLVLVDGSNTSYTFTAAEILAMNSIIRGEWYQATAVGSTATGLIAWW